MAQRNDQDPYKNGKGDRPTGKNYDPSKVNPTPPKDGKKK